jgi:signal transduction histidine kinase
MSLFGSRYSSVPPATLEGEGAVPYGPPASVETDPVLRYMSDEVIELAQELMVSFVRLSNSELGCSASKEYVDRLLESFEALKQDRSRTLAPFLQQLFQNETRVHLRAFMYRFENWFFGTFIEALSEYQNRGGELIEEGGVAALTSISDGINRQYEAGIDYLNFIKGVRAGLDSILNRTDVGRPYRADWIGYLMRASTLSHDYGNALMSLLHASTDIRRIAEGKDVESATRVLDTLMQPFDASSVVSIIDMVLRMTGKDAERVGISLEKKRMDDIVVPYDYRAPLFRIVNELVRNAIKYRDEEKGSRFVRIDSRRGKDELVISVTDNGVGIEDTDEAVKWGYRERPDLAIGTGVGLANIDNLAREHGWRFEIQSQHGACTRAKLFIGIARWNSPAPGSGEGAGELGGDPSDTSIAGAMDAANLASNQLSSAVAVGARAFLCVGLV